jgi:2-keto-4-pentenoate hydratase/2-oxohepta-3-ene-1,7-dioic acid hydratase in catechol pathway
MKTASIDIFQDSRMTPRTIYGIGRNYREHAAELNNDLPSEPIVFLKHLTSLRPLEKGPLAYPGEVFHHEAEVVLLVGRALKMGQKASWEDISAIGLGLDLTRREAQAALKAKGLPWTKAKAFDGAAPISLFIPRQKFPELDSIKFTLHISGELRQKGDTKDMLFSVESILNHLLTFTSLHEGDMIFTGTPSGVGPIKHGDSFKLIFTDLGIEFEGRL